MDIYSFKNNKKYVKFLYYYIVLLALSSVISFAFLDRLSSVAVFAVIVGFLVFISGRGYNTENIYLDEHEMKAGVTIPYMLISKIEVVDSKIEIEAEDGRKATIKMIDAESNFDKYKEMLDKLFEKARQQNENITGNSDAILSNIIENRKVFPEKELIELPPGHNIFNQKYKFSEGLPKIHEHDNKPPQAFGMFIEDRMVLLYTYESDLGDGWEDEAVHNNPARPRGAI